MFQEYTSYQHVMLDPYIVEMNILVHFVYQAIAIRGLICNLKIALQR